MEETSEGMEETSEGKEGRLAALGGTEGRLEEEGTEGR